MIDSQDRQIEELPLAEFRRKYCDIRFGMVFQHTMMGGQAHQYIDDTQKTREHLERIGEGSARFIPFEDNTVRAAAILDSAGTKRMTFFLQYHPDIGVFYCGVGPEDSASIQRIEENLREFPPIPQQTPDYQI